MWIERATGAVPCEQDDRADHERQHNELNDLHGSYTGAVGSTDVLLLQ